MARLDLNSIETVFFLKSTLMHLKQAIDDKVTKFHINLDSVSHLEY